MKVDRKQFVETLEKVTPALGVNILVPEFQYFQIDGDHVQAFDGVLLVDSVFPVDTKLRCAIPIEVLGLLSSLDVEQVDLVVVNNELRVETTKLEGKFSILDTPKLQPLSSIDVDNMLLIGSELITDLVEGLSFCRFGVSSDKTAGPICGVYLDKDLILSTDRYRIVRWKLDQDSKVTCSLPLKFINLLKRNQNEIFKLGCLGNETFVVILKDGTYASTCLLQGKYPNLLQYFPDSTNYRQVEFRKGIVSVIDRHLDLLKDVTPIDRETSVEVKGTTCTLTTKIPEKANLVEDVDVVMGGDTAMSFLINPTFLKEILGRCLSFKYFEEGFVLFETDKLSYLLQARNEEA